MSAYTEAMIDKAAQQLAFGESDVARPIDLRDANPLVSHEDLLLSQARRRH